MMEGQLRRDPDAVRLAAGLSLAAALIHLWVMPGHFEEWWGYGAFFLLIAIAQGAYSVALVLRPRRSLYLLGIAGNLAIIVFYLVTRTAGIPAFGPLAGEVEMVELIDVASKTLELALVVTLVMLWRNRPRQVAM